MSILDTNKYEELYDLTSSHEWEELKIKLLQYQDDVDINIRDTKNNLLITYAVRFNRIDVVNILLDMGASIDILDHDERSILYEPINMQYHELLDLLLTANKEIIGVSILNIKDKDKKTPLHYAIESKNIYAINQILKNGGDPNVKDNKGYNSLHQSIFTRDEKVIEPIVKVINDINSRCNTGETALHLAANLQLESICELLVNHGIDVNKLGYDYELSALHYASTLGNKNIIKLLLNKGADPNVQDIYGNTPVHYAIMENSYSCLVELINYKYQKGGINYNLWNIDSRIPLHLLFIDYEANKQYYINIILSKSNLSMQDNLGFSCLHYLCMYDLWKKYLNILEFRKLDIFSKNIDGKCAIDYIKKDDMDQFIEMIARSYINRLKGKKGNWIEKFDNICAKDYEELLPIEKDSLDGVTNSYTFQTKCTEIMKSKILKQIAKFKKGDLMPGKDKSYPIKKNKIRVEIDIGLKVNFTTYTGSTLDVLIGLIYILKKHKTACSTLSKNYGNNMELNKFYKSIGIIMSNRSEFLNFEIVWVQYKLYIMDSFYDMFKKCISNKKRFVVIPIGIEMKRGSHANYLIYDSKLNEAERFEPHGSGTPPGLNYNQKLLDDILEKRLETLDPNIKYIRPYDYLPKIGFQLMDATEDSRKKIGDPDGFCALWSLWYVDMRLQHPNVERNKLVNKLMKVIKDNNYSFRDLIRNYGKSIIDLRDNILSKVNIDINDWLNDSYTNEELDQFMIELNNAVKSVSIR